MKHHFKLPLIVLTIMLLQSCANSGRHSEATISTEVTTPFRKIRKADWLLGYWGAREGKSTTIEYWAQKDDTTLMGESFVIAGNDTVFREKLVLQQQGDDLYYIPTVANQNEGKPVPFRCVDISEKQMVFENPSHDFPQKIVYALVAKDSIVATISGNVKGKEKSEKFPMYKFEWQ